MLVTENSRHESLSMAMSSRWRRLKDLPAFLGASSTKTSATTVFLCALLGGCAAAPSINVLGAYFPDWMFCIVGAIVATSFLQSLMRAKGVVGRPGGLIAPLAYFALTVILALISWLAFFNN